MRFIPKYREGWVEAAPIRKTEMRLNICPHLVLRARLHGKRYRTNPNISGDEELRILFFYRNHSLSVIIRQLWPTDKKTTIDPVQKCFAWVGSV